MSYWVDKKMLLICFRIKMWWKRWLIGCFFVYYLIEKCLDKLINRVIIVKMWFNFFNVNRLLMKFSVVILVVGKGIWMYFNMFKVLYILVGKLMVKYVIFGMDELFEGDK